MLDKARIGLRYGIESALKLEYFVDNLLKSFTGIYEKIESGSKVYNTVRLLRGTLIGQGSGAIDQIRGRHV